MLDRRHFLIGVGSLLTATFVRKATAFSQALREPLILPPAKDIASTPMTISRAPVASITSTRRNSTL